MPHMEPTQTSHQADKLFRALADPTRLRILCILREGEHCVSDIVEILQVPQAKASHHLNYLHRVGMVDFRQQGLWCFYRLSPGRSLFHRQLLACLAHCSREVPNAAADRRRAARLREKGGCCPGLARGATVTVHHASPGELESAPAGNPQEPSPGAPSD